MMVAEASDPRVPDVFIEPELCSDLLLLPALVARLTFPVLHSKFVLLFRALFVEFGIPAGSLQGLVLLVFVGRKA
eukprot:3264635-Amphidinium_carterae.1